MGDEKLPNKLSALLRIAVADAQKCEAMPEVYTLDMNKWHFPQSGGPCQVCMAGAVMAQTLGAEPGRIKSPCSFGLESIEFQLEAINAMRLGHFEEAMEYLRGSREADTEEQQNATDRAGDKVHAALAGFGERGIRAPWLVYLEAAGILERAGL
jgi:hypothetical protein